VSLIQAVVLDWAGTTVDRGSVAPVRAIQEVFGRHGIAVSDADARREMGLAKREHLRCILERIDRRRAVPDLDDLYRDFTDAQLRLLTEHSELIPGVLEAVADMRGRGIRVGSTTGYSRPLLYVLAARAREQGYEPDCSVTPEEAGGGRPHPYMMYVAATRLQRYPLPAFVTVGDTPADIREGLNAGAWTVGVSETGSADRDELERAGAHFVIESIAHVGPTLDEIEFRLSTGAQP
jgi:phosphonoacetaldehyde hydrolase